MMSLLSRDSRAPNTSRLRAIFIQMCSTEFMKHVSDNTPVRIIPKGIVLKYVDGQCISKGEE